MARDPQAWGAIGRTPLRKNTDGRSHPVWDMGGRGSGFLEGTAVGRRWVYGERLLTRWEMPQGAARENLGNGHFGELAEVGLKVLWGHQLIQVDGLPLAWRGKRMDRSVCSLLVHRPFGKPVSLAARLYPPTGARRQREAEDPPLHVSPLHVFIFPSHSFPDPK